MNEEVSKQKRMSVAKRASLERKQREKVLCYADDAHVQDSVKTIKSLKPVWMSLETM